ncbi:hypothetical protein EZS27_021333 [termite gut metagenome]|uniref:Type IX secretion system protein PorV domain-containing protein n=1 Tax=termite gut metagenome TaxID=433724 RepID=A0A5J4RAZ9_9ZZZZ
MVCNSRITISMFLLGLFTIFPAVSQEESANETAAVPFLRIVPEARSEAMGGMGNVASLGTGGIFNNASANLFHTGRGGVEVSLSARRQMPDASLYSAGGYYHIDSKNSISLGARYFMNPEIAETTNEYGDIMVNKMRPKEMAFEMAYGRKLGKNIAASLTMRYIYSDLGSIRGSAKAANATAFDLGVFYTKKCALVDSAKWAVGFQASNFGTKIKYLNQENSLPGKVQLGGTLFLPFSENHQLTGSSNVGYWLQPSDAAGLEAAVGVEYAFFKRGFLRAGYHVGDESTGYGNFATVGAGVSVGLIKLDGSYWIGASNEEFKNSLYFTMGIGF